MREPHMPGPLPARDWNDAFAALPSETPPTDALQRVLAQLPMPARRRSWRLPLALAASLLTLACLPLVLRELPHATTHVSAPKRDVAATTTTPVPGPVASTPSATGTTTPSTPALRVADAATATVIPETQPIRKQVASTRVPHRKQSHRMHKPATEPSDNAMEPLYAESARLEALLALARDERVASATVLALGSDFEARVSGIDAALMQPSLDAQRRLELWRDRVSALRAYASFEGTQRALAARGERYDATLVSID